MQLGRRKTRGQRENNHPAARADIEQARIFRPGEITKVLDQLFRLRPGHERTPVAEENLIAKLDRAEQMLKRLTLAAPPDERAERRQLRLGKRAFEFEIKLDPFFA